LSLYAMQTGCATTAPVFFSSLADRLSLPPFPTRRSSDLDRGQADRQPDHRRPDLALARDRGDDAVAGAQQPVRPGPAVRAARPRSEEHTSELQSRENLVCRLLLEKKKLMINCHA